MDQEFTGGQYHFQVEVIAPKVYVVSHIDSVPPDGSQVRANGQQL